MEPAINIDKVVQAYSAIRDARTARKRTWEADDLLLETDMHTLKVLLLDTLNKTGAQSVRTDHGTVYRTTKLKPSAADWNAFYDWIMQDRERFEGLEKRIKATFVQQYMDENDGLLPPGVNAHREFEVAVRRPGSSAPANGD